MELILATAIFGVAMGAMSIGVMLNGRRLRGSCGGPEVVTGTGEALSCGACPKKEAEVCPSDDPLVVHSALQIAESRPGARVDWVARVTHHLVESDGALRFALKKVVLVDNDRELTTIDFLL